MILTLVSAVSLLDYVLHSATLLTQNGSTIFDDAYMFVRYATNLWHGGLFAWNPDHVPTYGPTSLPYVLWVALLRPLFGGEMEKWIVLASWLPGVAAVLVMVFACYLGLTANGIRRTLAFTLAILVIPLLLSDSTFQYHSATGMETTLALLANAILLVAAHWILHRPTVGRALAVGIAAYGTYVVRPDSGIVAVIYPALTIVLLCPVPRLQRITLLVAFAGILVTLIGADALLKYAIFGEVLPLSFYVKQSSFYAGYVGLVKWNPLVFIRIFLAAALPFLLLIGLGARQSMWRWIVTYLIPVLTSLLYYFTVSQIMGYGGRYYYPTMVFVIAGGVLLTGNWVASKDGLSQFLRDAFRRLPVLFAIVMIVIFPWWEPAEDWYAVRFLMPAAVYAQVDYIIPAVVPLPETSYALTLSTMTAIAKDLPAGTVIAASEVGQLAAMAPQVTILDEVGLNNSTIAHSGFSMAYLLHAAPDLIWLPHEDYTGIRATILESNSFNTDYEYYPGAFLFGIALRKESSFYSAIKAAVVHHWAQLYQDLSMSDYVAQPVERF